MIKRVSKYMTAVLLTALLAGCSSTGTNEAQLANPWKTVDSMAQAEEAAGFDVVFPAVESASFQVMESDTGNMIQMQYTQDENEITLRKAPAADDISGDYNEYTQTKEVDITGKTVTMKGSDGLYYVAYWKDGDYSYSISSSKGLKEADMEALAAQIF